MRLTMDDPRFPRCRAALNLRSSVWRGSNVQCSNCSAILRPRLRFLPMLLFMGIGVAPIAGAAYAERVWGDIGFYAALLLVLPLTPVIMKLMWRSTEFESTRPCT